MKIKLFFITLFLSASASATTIDFGQAAKYDAFVKQDFSVTSSDTQGRIAVGGNLNVNGGYDIGYKINGFGMGDGPTLVVAGDVNKQGAGHLNIYEDGPHLSPHSGDLVYAGSVNGNPIEANLIKVEQSELPVDFNSAFAHLTQLSNDLASKTASGTAVGQYSKLTFTPTEHPADGVYIFNVTQEQINQNVDWSVEGVSENATVVFNVSNPNAVEKKSWDGSGCQQGATGCVYLKQTTISINGKLLSSGFAEHSLDGRPDSQVLFNFAGANEVHLRTDLYASVLAPSADIFAPTSVIYGQVIGESWTGNMQINHDPFTPVGSTPPPAPVSEPATIFSFLLAGLLVAWSQRRNKKASVLAEPALA